LLPSLSSCQPLPVLDTVCLPD